MKKTLLNFILCLIVLISTLSIPNSYAQTELVNGDVARESDDIDVYIIKFTGGKQFKRLVLNPQVFKSYGHLRWESVKVVDPGTLDDYTTSTLVRAFGDEKVYMLFPDGDIGTKRWVESLNCFINEGYDWDSVYIINAVDRDNYITGATICGTVEELSKLECEISLETGKETNCRCVVNENKNKFTVIVNKNGALNNNVIKQKLNSFLASVKNDVSIENIGISYFEGNSISELDQFIENLYYQEDVGYVIVIGDELGHSEILNGILGQNLSLVGKERNLPGGAYNPNALCKEIVISWIIPPVLYSDEEKIDFIRRVIDTYTRYHNNENNILSEYSDDYLRIQWENGHPTIGMDLSFIDRGYEKNRILVWNHEYNKIENELKNKHYLLVYNVHGSPTMIGLGLNPANETNEYLAVYTTLDEFSEFVQKTGVPALLVHAIACGGSDIQGIGYGNIKECCWPQIMMDVGIWAYYGVSGGGDEVYNMERLLSKGTFFGYIIRNNPINQVIIFGDVTAHFK